MFNKIFKIQKDLIKEEKIYFLWVIAVVVAVCEFFLTRKIAELDVDITDITRTLITTFILITVCIVLSYFMNYCIKMKNAAYTQKLRAKIVYEFSKKQYVDLEKNSDGKVLNLFISDIPAVVDANVNEVTSIFRGITLFISAIILGFLLSWELTLLILVLSFLAIIIPKYFNEKLEKSWQTRQENQAESTTLLLQIFNSKTLINSLNSEQFLLGKLRERYMNFTLAQYENTKLQYLMSAVSIALGIFFDVVTLCFSFYLIYIGRLTVGGFIAFSLLNNHFTWLFYQLPTLFASLKRSEVSFDRIDEFLTVEVKDENVEKFEIVSFMNVSYAYDKNLVLENVNFTFSCKDKVLLVGESGSGKSTFIKMLLDFYKPVSGKIEVNHKRNNSGYYSYVPQKVELFNGTIRENITLGRKISDESILEILEKLEMREFVEGLKDGLSTILDTHEKMNLSAGQLQKIGIARALVEEGKVLVLDEIFANVDEKSEKSIAVLLENLDLPIIVISHRLGDLSRFMKVYRVIDRTLKLVE